MLIVIYEYVYSMFINKFGEDNCAKHIISSSKKKRKRKNDFCYVKTSQT